MDRYANGVRLGLDRTQTARRNAGDDQETADVWTTSHRDPEIMVSSLHALCAGES